jgi:hypothetical protein
MQTFLPYKNFAKSARVLDDRRLGKQRVEASQILDLLEGRSDNNWKHHVAVRMWQGYTNALKLYYNIIVGEWVDRGKQNNMPFMEIRGRIVMPPWLSDPRLPLSHRSNLMRKDPEFYGQYNWSDADPKAPYWWPVPMKTPALHKIMVQYWG